MNFQKIYEYRFKDVNHNQKQIVWKEISEYVYRLTDQPKTVLDPAGGMCEFINNIPAEEKWAIDLNKEFLEKYADQSVRQVIGNNLTVELPKNYFDLIFISNRRNRSPNFCKKCSNASKKADLS